MRHPSGLHTPPELAPLEITDRRDANQMIVSKQYGLPWQDFIRDDRNEDFRMRAGTLIDVLENPSVLRKRRNPFWQVFPSYLRHSVTLSNTATRLRPPDRINLKTEFFEIKTRVETTKTSMTAIWTLKTLQPEVPADDVATYVDAVNQMEDMVSWYYDLPGPAAHENVKTGTGPKHEAGGMLDAWKRLLGFETESKG